MEASTVALVTLGPQGRITDSNEVATALTGVSRHELIGTDLSDYFTEPARARAGHEQVLAQGGFVDYSLTVRHRDGHLIPVLYNSLVYRDVSGVVVGCFVVIRDLTGQRKAESDLQASDELFRTIFEYATVGIAHVALSGKFVRVNPQFCQITGYTAEELEAMQFHDITHPADIDAYVANVESLIAGEGDTYVVEKRYLHKTGDIVWVELTVSIVRDPGGTPLMFVSVVRDMTAQRQAEADLRALTAGLEARVKERTAELERTNQDLEAFTYSVSHDLRAPLRALSGFSQALVEEYGERLDETGRSYTERIGAASDRMAQLIDDLLQLSRISRGRMDLEPVNLSAEVASMAEELRSREPDRRVHFVVQDGVWATADRRLIGTVVENLLGNAWKFTSHRSEACIEFGRVAVDDAPLCCYVRDDGAGFDPAYVAKLFLPFQRLHLTTEFPGTGVGLASVRRIVERHGGRAWAEGAVDQGATIYFTLDPKVAP
jgi:PAS domain S-box-containing protein